MGKTILILGGGIGGTAAANVLSKLLKNHQIILVDREEYHLFRPSLPLLLVNLRHPHQIVRRLTDLEKKGVKFIQAEVNKVMPQRQQVETTQGLLNYDYLIVALGADQHPETVPGQIEAAFNPYNLQDACRLQQELQFFKSGRIIVFIAALPYTGPNGPYEFICLLDTYFRKRGVRNQIQLTLITPEPALFPLASRKINYKLAKLMTKKQIQVYTNAQVLALDHLKNELVLTDGRIFPGDLFIGIPTHRGSKALQHTSLALEQSWCLVDPHTLAAKLISTEAADNIYCIGDAAGLKVADGSRWAPKIGIFAHYQAEVVARNIALKLSGKTPQFRYQGKGAGVAMITDYNHASLLSINYYASQPRTFLLPPMSIGWLVKTAFEKYWLNCWF